MKLVLWVGIGYLLAFVVPWVVGTVLGCNPELGGLAFLIVLGIAVVLGAYVGQSFGKPNSRNGGK